jgi:hypothetical protein
MPEQETLDRARQDAAEGKAPSTQAGEFVVRKCITFAKANTARAQPKQAIALAFPKRACRSRSSAIPERHSLRKDAQNVPRAAYKQGQRNPRKRTSPKRSRATLRALRREGHSAASHTALSRQTRSQRRHKTFYSHRLACTRK